jgi:hypothetical protein
MSQKISESIIQDCKRYITKESADLLSIQEFWTELQNSEYESPPDWSYIFQKVYLHACLHGHRTVAEWLRKEFELKANQMDIIAYRQTYSYGEVLLRKKNKN